ncbi:hypothetical protein N6H14_20715 [Paenibacillus sp. CC-CFT747]|nr:hypothetical protein N6H14_20715 [Paenibacillus sp. CC-CFT747]
MKQKRRLLSWVHAVLALAVLAGPGLVPQEGQAEEAAGRTAPIKAAPPGRDTLTSELGPFYQEVAEEWKQKGYKPASQTVTLPGSAITAQSDPALSEGGSYEGKNKVLLWKSGRDNWIEYTVDIPEDGLYEIALTYHTYSDPAGSTVRRPVNLSLQMDGVFPYREARALSLRRQFKDNLPVKRDEFGDDIRPRPVEIQEWINQTLADSAGGYQQPLQWFLSKGKHTLRFTGSDPVVIESVAVKPPVSIPSYPTVSKEYPAGQPKNSQVVTIQAEEMAWKNDVAIQLTPDHDPLSVPFADGYDRFNSLGENAGRPAGSRRVGRLRCPRAAGIGSPCAPCRAMSPICPYSGP